MKKSKKITPFQEVFSLEATESELPQLCQRILGHAQGRGFWLLLEGPLGSGKTRFSQALLAALQVVPEFQGSPTFSIANVYQDRSGQTVTHIDLYRLDSEEELESSGVVQQLWESGGIGLIEWASRFGGVFTSERRPSGFLIYELKIEFVESRPPEVKSQLRRWTLTEWFSKLE